MYHFHRLITVSAVLMRPSHGVFCTKHQQPRTRGLHHAFPACACIQAHLTISVEAVGRRDVVFDAMWNILRLPVRPRPFNPSKSFARNALLSLSSWQVDRCSRGSLPCLRARMSEVGCWLAVFSLAPNACRSKVCWRQRFLILQEACIALRRTSYTRARRY